MNAQEETTELSARREKLIQRMLALSDEQLDRLITLYSQQAQGSLPDDPARHPTSA